MLKRFLGSWSAPAEPLLAHVRERGLAVERVVFTRNRRVMVSLGDGGRTLRVHECFREAPGEVRGALADLYAGSAARREEAREVIRAFLRVIPVGPSRARGRRVRTSDENAVRRLREEFDRVNRDHFEGSLPRVPLFLSGRMRRRNGHFSPEPLEIVISRRLCEEAEPGEAERTLRHEMIHLWQHARGSRVGHGADFRRWALRLGIHPRATRSVVWSEGGRDLSRRAGTPYYPSETGTSSAEPIPPHIDGKHG